MRIYLFGLVVLSLFVFLLAGRRGEHTQNRPVEIFPDMDRQAKVKPQAPSAFFSDGKGARTPVAGTVPMGYEIPTKPGGPSPADLARDISQPSGVFSRGTDYFDTGRMGGMWGEGFPFPVTKEVLERGRERFNINCAVCHGAAGGGNGQVSNFWSGVPVANLMDARIRGLPEGQIFDVISHGKGIAPNWTMFPYGDRITVEDRWAVIAWLRTLQRSQRATIEDLTPAERAQLK